MTDTLQRLFPLDQLEEGACQEFEISRQPPQHALQGFALKRDQRIYAYRNQCPHTGVTLNWLANQFMDVDNQYIQCATHGALFRVEDGLCVRGPCAGASLMRLPVLSRDHHLYLQWNEYIEHHESHDSEDANPDQDSTPPGTAE